MNRSYALDKSRGKLLGVCAGLANYTGADVTGVRILAVLLTLFLLGPVALLAYFLTAFIANDG
jgi:phage shock protein C